MRFYGTHKQTYQVSRISRETPSFWSHLPLTRHITKISRISSTEFGRLILRKLVKIVATRCHILTLKCTKFDFGWGSAQTPLAELTYSTSRHPGLGVLILRGRSPEGGYELERGWNERRRGRKGKEGGKENIGR